MAAIKPFQKTTLNKYYQILSHRSSRKTHFERVGKKIIPMQAQSFTAGKFNYTIHYAKGKVVGKDKNIETKISGSGGGGTVNKGTGDIDDISITSTTLIHDKIYLQQENGKEVAIELTNWDLACREGHEMLVIWIKRGTNESGSYVVVKNYTTDSIKFNDAKIKDLANQHLIASCLLAFFIILATSIILYFIGGGIGIVLGVIALAVYEMMVRNRSKTAKGIIMEQLNQFLETQK